jgi:cell division protease FtsH
VRPFACPLGITVTLIGLSEIDDAVDRIIAGMEGQPLIDGRSKRLIAYHEVGHALIGSLVKDHDPVQKVTVIPRGQAKGLTWFSPDDDQTLISRREPCEAFCLSSWYNSNFNRSF